MKALRSQRQSSGGWVRVALLYVVILAGVAISFRNRAAHQEGSTEGAPPHVAQAGSKAPAPTPRAHSVIPSRKSWRPAHAYRIESLIRWTPGVQGIEMDWVHLRQAGDPYFSGVFEGVASEMVSFPTRFFPVGVYPLRGTRSFLIWGHTTRGDVALERWTFGDPTLTYEAVLPADLTQIDDLAELNTGGLFGPEVLYDLQSVDPVTDYGPPRCVLFKQKGSSSIWMIDLTQATGTPTELAGPGPPSSSSTGATTPTFLVPLLGQFDLQFLYRGLSPTLGQLIVLVGPGTHSEDLLVVLDSDLDGVPDNVTAVDYGLLNTLGLLNHQGPANGLDAHYDAFY